MPPVNTVKGPKYNSCPDSSPCAKNAVDIIENNNQFVWVEGWKWYDAIKARKEGTATKEQVEILDRGHWKE